MEIGLSLCYCNADGEIRLYIFANVTYVMIRMCSTRCDARYTYMYTLSYPAILEYVSSALFSFLEDGIWPKYCTVYDNMFEVEFGSTFRPRRMVF